MEKPKFSAKVPVEETDTLIALHNLTPESSGVRLSGKNKNNAGGSDRGRKVGDNLHRRIQEENAGEQYTEGAGEYREAKENVFGERRPEGRIGQDVLLEDSEGRKLTDNTANQLYGTSVVDKYGHPIALYHFPSQ